MQMNSHLGSDLFGRPRFADVLVDRLIENDVGYIFGMPAESVNCLVDAVGRRSEIGLIAVRHESAASWMAVGYARGSGAIGVCFGTAGPGVTHLLPGVYDGLYDCLPILAVSGQVAREDIGTKSFQEIESSRLLRNGTWRSSDISSTDQITIFDQLVLGVRLQQTSAHVSIPSDVLNSPVDQIDQGSPYWAKDRAPAATDKKRIADLADYLCKNAPLIVLGAGSSGVADCARLLSDALDVKLMALPESGIPESLVTAVDNETSKLPAENILLIGRPTAGIERYFPSAETVLEITDIFTPGFDSGRQRIGISGDISLTLQALVAALWDREKKRPDDAGKRSELLQLRGALAGWDILAERLAGASVAVDTVRIDELSRRFLGEGSKIHCAWNLEAEGSALPMSIGLALATENRCYALTDLASLDQYVAELSTAVRYSIPITVVCITESGNTVSDLAHAFGIPTFWAGNDSELNARLRETSLESGPVVILTSAVELEPDPAAVEGPRTDVIEFTNDLLGALAQSGVDSAYVSKTSCQRLGLAGDTSSDLNLHVVADIQAAAMRATAAFKASGRVACVFVTSPSELLAQLNGLYDASFDSANVLLFSFELDNWLMDPAEVLQEISASSVVLNGTDGDSSRLRNAFASISGGITGVTHVHVSHAAIAAGQSSALVAGLHLDSIPIPVSLIGLAGSTVAAPEVVAQAAGLLKDADHVSIVVGRGASGAHRELVELAARTGSPLYCTMGGLAADVVGEHCDGLVGTSGHDDAMQKIRASQLVILVGVSWRGSAFELAGSSTVISINSDPLTFLRLPPKSMGLLGDAREMLETLTGHLDSVADGRHSVRMHIPQIKAPRENSRKLQAESVARIIDSELRQLERASTLSVDVGINTLWAYRYVRSAHRYLWTASFATMGFAVPAAVDVAVRKPDEISVAIVGDGGIGITLAELRNAAKLESTAIIVVFNNSALAAIKFESWIMGWPDTSSEFQNCDFASFARHCGLSAVTVRTSKEFGREFRKALRNDAPILIDARCPAEEAPTLAGEANIRQFLGFLTGWIREGKTARTGAWSLLKAFAYDKVR